MTIRAAALLLVLMCFTFTASAQSSAGVPAASGNAQAPVAQLPTATVAMLQQRAEGFLRNLYAWGPEFGVKAGAVKPSAVPELYEITVEVSLQGQSESALVYVTKDGRYMVRGEIAEMDADPFAAVRGKLVLDGTPSKGPSDAQVTIVEFGDFQCPSCRQLDLVFRRLLAQYPQQIRLVFKDFPLEQIHPWAMTAALVGRCAYAQSPETFWKVHDAIYDNQDRITAETAYEKLLQLGVDAGLNSTALQACIANPQTAESVRKSIAEGRSLGINSTPTSFVNGREVIGPNEALLNQYIRFVLRN